MCCHNFYFMIVLSHHQRVAGKGDKMKIEITNRFHGKKLIVSVKDYVWNGKAETVLEMLEADAWYGNPYAKRKLREIKNKTCGSKSCSCGGFNDEKILEHIKPR